MRTLNSHIDPKQDKKYPYDYTRLGSVVCLKNSGSEEII